MSDLTYGGGKAASVQASGFVASGGRLNHLESDASGYGLELTRRRARHARGVLADPPAAVVARQSSSRSRRDKACSSSRFRAEAPNPLAFREFISIEEILRAACRAFGQDEVVAADHGNRLVRVARLLSVGPRFAKGQTVNRGQDIDPIRSYADLEDEAGAL